MLYFWWGFSVGIAYSLGYLCASWYLKNKSMNYQKLMKTEQRAKEAYENHMQSHLKALLEVLKKDGIR
jgi:adenine-specific DNA methylase